MAETLAVPTEVQEKFIRENKSRSSQIEPENLFYVEQHSQDTFARLYMGPSRIDEGRFGIRAAAFYHRGSELPTNLVVLEKDRQMELRFRDDWLTVVGILEEGKKSTQFMADYTPSGELFSMGVGPRFARNEFHRSPYILELEERRLHNMPELLAKSATEYNAETGVVTFRHKEYIMRAPRRIDRDKVLEKLFTKELRNNPETASSENDLWRKANLLEIFGQSWKRLVEQEVFSATSPHSA